MKISIYCPILALATLLVAFLPAAMPTATAAPTAEQALALMPSQPGVDYDTPKASEMSKCRISPKKFDGRVGWIVENPEGLILRRFVDTNGDNVVDQWGYYKDGVEVYRDISSKPGAKKDQFRWFHSAGTRWGIDTNGDEKIDAWKAISAEEATAEIVAALIGRDADRFEHVLLSPQELRGLGLGKAKEDAIAAKIDKAPSNFQTLADRQKTFPKDAKWIQFSGQRPGTVPSGTDGSAKDIEVYENVVAIVQVDQKHVQLQIGTLVQVGDTWKVIDAPAIPAEGQADLAMAGIFFHAAPVKGQTAGGGAPSEESQRLMAELEKLDPADLRRAELLEKIAEQARSAEDRGLWYRQLADTLSAAVQQGKLADGDKRLGALFEKVQKIEDDKNLAAYVKVRELMAIYALGLQAAKSDVAAIQKIQGEWLKSLEKYVGEYPTSPDAAEAMLQLGIAREYAGEEDDAKKWYGRVARDFPDAPQAKKAAGAAARLDSVGKTLSFSGRTAAGGSIDLANYRGRVVLLQFWATWSTPAKNDMATLKQLATKYGRSFAVIGVCLDTDVKELNGYLTENPLPWQQVFEGGPDSRPANALGIITVPTMLLIDQQGKVISRNVQAADLEDELKKLLK